MARTNVVDTTARPGGDRRAQLAEPLALAAVVALCAWLGARYGWRGQPGDAIATAMWPFYLSSWDSHPVFNGRVLLPLGALALVWLPLRRWLRPSPGDHAVTALVSLVAVAYLFHLACNVQRYGLEASFRLSFQRGVEYYRDVAQVRPGFLAAFPDGIGRVSLHGGTHPPLPILVLYLAGRLGFASVHDAELFVSMLAALAALPLWGAARRLTDEETARAAVPLYLFACVVTAFSVASMDTVIMAFAVVALYGFTVALDGRAWGGVVWGLGFAAATLSTFTAGMLALGWAVLLVARAHQLGRGADGAARRWRALALGPLVVVAVYALLAVGFGYRPLHVFEVCWRAFAASADVRRPRLLSLVGGPVAFLGALGLPLGGLTARVAAGAVRRFYRGDRDTAALVAAALLPIAVCVALGKPRAEVERVFLLFVPTAVIAVAAAARRWYRRGPGWVAAAVLALALQSIAVEIFWYTLW